MSRIFITIGSAYSKAANVNPVDGIWWLHRRVYAPSVLTAWREAPWARRLLPGRFGLSRPPVWLRSAETGVEKFSTASEFSTAKNPDRDIY